MITKEELKKVLSDNLISEEEIDLFLSKRLSTLYKRGNKDNIDKIIKILREKAYRQLELLRKNQDTIAALKKNLIEDYMELQINDISAVTYIECYGKRFIFMGDAGSLALGGLLAAVAMVTKEEIALVLIGGVFVIEVLSDIIQIGSFKLTGKRVFKMAPIHHHFELSGWKETKVVLVFWLCGLALSLIGLLIGVL